jgi:hypothetical protein
VVLLLYSDASYETARRQCSPRFGHVGMFNTTKAMDRFFDMYEAWLAERRQQHSPALFREWATRYYVPGNASAELKLLDPPTTLPIGKPVTVTVRATNKGNQPWHFKMGPGAGVYARCTFVGPEGVIAIDAAGLFRKTVAPGESIDIPVALPVIKKPGAYQLTVDLSERNFDFVQFGSEPLIYDWTSSTPPL